MWWLALIDNLTQAWVTWEESLREGLATLDWAANMSMGDFLS